MKYKIILIFIISILSFNSCDILRCSLFEVSAWTPGEGYHSENRNIDITIDFSNNPDKISVERNFSLTGNENKINGRFSWNGKKLSFSPYTKLEKNTDYIINISAEAHDVDGVSMNEAFCGEFTTRIDNNRPVLLSCFPALYEVITDLKQNITLEFSAPVSLRTLYENVMISPSMNGLWKIDSSGKTAVFSPAQMWTQNTRYEIRVSSLLTDNNGMNIRKEFISVFNTGKKSERPVLLKVIQITKNGEEIEMRQDSGYNSAGNILIENKNWEKDDKFKLIFSRHVDSSSVKNCISADDAPNLLMDTSAGFTSEVIFRFETPPVYGNRFSLRIKAGIKDIFGIESGEEYVYKVVADGKQSMPPQLIGIRMPMSPENAEDKNLKYFNIDSLFDFIHISDENYPSGESVKTWIELYFNCAYGAVIDLFSVMELFKIETSNNVITFSAREVKNNNFSAEDSHEGTENYQRIEIKGNLVNSTYFGIINFLISSGLTDSLGNKNEKLQKISLIK